jgi:hypothetical protein
MRYFLEFALEFTRVALKLQGGNRKDFHPEGNLQRSQGKTDPRENTSGHYSRKRRNP